MNPYWRGEYGNQSTTDVITLDIRDTSHPGKVCKQVAAPINFTFINIKVKPKPGEYATEAKPTEYDNLDGFNIHKLFIDTNVTFILVRFYNVTSKLYVVVTPYPPKRDNFDELSTVVPLSSNSTYYRPKSGPNMLYILNPRSLCTEEFGTYTILYVGVSLKKYKRHRKISRKFVSDNYSVEFLTVSCKRWDKWLDRWTTRDCEANDETYITEDNSGEIHCGCTKDLGTVMATIETFPGEPIRLLKINLSLSPGSTYVAMITIFSILALFLIFLLLLLLYFKRKKGKNDPMFLLDNDLNKQYKYLIGVYTGNQGNAGTTANICIQLIGCKISAAHLLCGESAVILRRGNQDWFILLTLESLGNLTEMNIWTDGYGVRPSWYCEKIIVHDLQTHVKWIFLVNDWISCINHNAFVTVKTSVFEQHMFGDTLRNITRYPRVSCYNYEDLVQGDHIFTEKYVEDIPNKTKYHSFMEILKKYHLLFSLFNWPPKIEKLVLLLLLQLLIMFFLYLYMSELHRKSIFSPFGRCCFEITVIDIVVMVLIAILSYLLMCPFRLLFRSSTPLLKKIRFQGYTNRYKLGRRARLLTWISVLLLILALLTFLLFFGLYLSFYPSIVWVTLVILGMAFAVFIVETLAISYFVIYKKKLDEEYEEEDIQLDVDDIHRQMENIAQKYGSNGFRPILKKFYKPLPPEVVQEKAERGRSRMRLESLFNDLLMFLVYMIILYFVVLTNKDPMAYQSCRNFEHMFVDAAYTKTMKFTEISNERNFWDYLEFTFVPALHPKVWYFNFSMQNNRGLIIDFNTKMLGVPRIRQIRIKNNTCLVPKMIRFMTTDCNPEFSSSIVETSDFGESWQKLSPDWKVKLHERKAKVWKYQDGAATKSVKVHGKLATYTTGGYIAQLGRRPLNTRLILNYLRANGWIDKLTRAIFIEASFYNTNQNLFTIVTLKIEKSETGKYIQTSTIRTTKLLFLYHELETRTFLTFTFFVLILLIFFCVRTTQLMKTSVRYFFSKIWNIVDFVIIIVGFLFIIFYFVRSNTVAELLSELDRSFHNKFVSFLQLAYWDDIVNILASFLVAISTIRIWRLMEFNRVFRVCERTLREAAKDLLTLAVLGLLMFLSFSISGYVIFGSYSEDFWSVGDSMITLMCLSMGVNKNFNYDVIQSTYAGLGYIYYVVFMVAMLVMINIFITAIIVAHVNAKRRIAEEEGAHYQYPLWRYIWEEIKYCRSPYKGREIHSHLQGGEDKLTDSEISENTLINISRIDLMYDLIESLLRLFLEQYDRQTSLELVRHYTVVAQILEILHLHPNTIEILLREREDKFICKCTNDKIEDMRTILCYLLDKSSCEHHNPHIRHIDFEKELTYQMLNINDGMNKIMKILKIDASEVDVCECKVPEICFSPPPEDVINTCVDIFEGDSPPSSICKAPCSLLTFDKCSMVDFEDLGLEIVESGVCYGGNKVKHHRSTCEKSPDTCKFPCYEEETISSSSCKLPYCADSTKSSICILPDCGTAKKSISSCEISCYEAPKVISTVDFRTKRKLKRASSLYELPHSERAKLSSSTYDTPTYEHEPCPVTTSKFKKPKTQVRFKDTSTGVTYKELGIKKLKKL